MSNKEEKLKESMKRLKAQARERVSQRQVFHFRLEPENIQALYEIAGKQRLPVGTMVRNWVIEKIEHTANNARDSLTVAEASEYRITNSSIDSKLEDLQKQLARVLNRLEKLEGASINEKKIRKRKAS